MVSTWRPATQNRGPCMRPCQLARTAVGLSSKHSAPRTSVRTECRQSCSSSPTALPVIPAIRIPSSILARSRAGEWGPGGGSGDAANIANRFNNAGGVWVNSAANSRKAHYQATWFDSNGDGWHEFSDQGWIVDPFITYNQQTGQWEIFCVTQDLLDRNDGAVPLFGALNWNQWGGTPSTNMTICVSEVDTQGYWIADPYCQSGLGNVASVETWEYAIQAPGCYG